MGIFTAEITRNSSHPHPMKPRMIRLRLGSLEIRISFFSFAVMTFAVFISGKDNLIFLCLLSSLLHELSHLFFIVLFSGGVRSVTLSAEGMTISQKESIYSISQEFIISISGVFVNILLGSVCYFISKAYDFSKLFDFSMCNLCLGAFNALPLQTLDGGQALMLILGQKFDYRLCQRLMNILSFILLVPIMISGVCVLFESRYNYSLLIVSIYLIFVITSKEMR